MQKGQFCCNLFSIKIWSSHFRLTLCKRGWQLDNGLTDLWKQLRFKRKLVYQNTNERADWEIKGRYSTLIINIIRRSFEISRCDFLGLENKIQEELTTYNTVVARYCPPCPPPPYSAQVHHSSDSAACSQVHFRSCTLACSRVKGPWTS